MVNRKMPNANLPDGSRWVHFWFEPVACQDWLALAMQYEQVGVSISAAPYVMIPSTALRTMLAVLATLPGAVQDEHGVSVPLSMEGE